MANDWLKARQIHRKDTQAASAQNVNLWTQKLLDALTPMLSERSGKAEIFDLAGPKLLS
jgi:hypothetical protein